MMPTAEDTHHNDPPTTEEGLPQPPPQQGETDATPPASTPSPSLDTTTNRQTHLQLPRTETLPPDAPAGVLRVEAGLKALNLRDVARFVHVESDYYDWPLEKRATRLAAPSPSHLCKTILFENTKYKPVDGVNELNPLYSRFYAVCVQYTDKLNAQRLGNFVKGLSGGLNKEGREQPRKNFNMRVASESSNEALTGFEKGGVCPFGMLQRVPIILTENITKLDPPIMFLGAGHIDWKVGLPVDTFLDRQHDPKCFVADLS